MLNINLENKTALICGASKGIGRACAQAIAQCGASIILLARNAEAMEEIIHLLPKSNHQHHQVLVADMSDPHELQKKIQLLAFSHTVHILVNNSGGPPAGPILSANTEEFTAAFRQHLLCNHILATQLIPGMRTAQYGRIINIISTSVKQPIDNLGVSNTIRAAVANWAKTLSNEVASSHITVNNILPGATETERLTAIIDKDAALHNTSTDEIQMKMLASIPMKRFATPDEIAYAVAFLASPLASYITGINLPVDGGRTKSL